MLTNVKVVSDVHSGDADNTDFDYPFKTTADTELAVYVKDKSVTPNTIVKKTNFTVQANSHNNYSGGTITYPNDASAKLAVLERLVIVLALPLTQSTTFTSRDNHKVLEDALDVVTKKIQVLDNEISRAIKLPITEQSLIAATETTNPPTAEYFIRMNAAGTGFEWTKTANTTVPFSELEQGGASTNDIIIWNGSGWVVTTNVTLPGTLTASGGGTLTGTWTDLGTVTTVNIDGGTLDGSIIGGASAAAGTFTVLSASTSLALASGATVTAIHDEDAMGSDSATALATQQSIKAYIATQIVASDEPAASETVAGVLEIATDTEVATGTDTGRAVSPESLKNASLITVQALTSLGAVNIGGVAVIGGGDGTFPVIVSDPVTTGWTTLPAVISELDGDKGRIYLKDLEVAKTFGSAATDGSLIESDNGSLFIGGASYTGTKSTKGMIHNQATGDLTLIGDIVAAGVNISGAAVSNIATDFVTDLDTKLVTQKGINTAIVAAVVATSSADHVTGPGSAIDNTMVVFDDTTGKLIQGRNNCTISDAGLIQVPGGLYSTSGALTTENYVHAKGGQMTVGEDDTQSGYISIYSMDSLGGSVNLYIGEDEVVDSNTFWKISAGASGTNSLRIGPNTDIDIISIDTDGTINAPGGVVATGAVTGSNLSGSSSGANTGDQATIVGITGTIAQFNTALSDGSFVTGGGTVSGTNTGDEAVASTSVSGTVELATTAETTTGTDTARAVTPDGLKDATHAFTSTITASNLSGSNTGDQTTIVGITGTIAQFNTAVSDATISTGGGTATGTNTGDEAAASTSVSGTVELATTAETTTGTDTARAVTPDGLRDGTHAFNSTITASNLSGTNTGDQTTIAGITGTIAQFNTAVSDATISTGGGTATGTNTGDQATIAGITGTHAQFNTALSDGTFVTTSGAAFTGAVVYGLLETLGTTGAVTWDLDADPVALLDITGNVTFTINNINQGTNACLHFKQHSTARTVAWPAAVKWAGGSAPDLSTVNAEYLISFFSPNGTDLVGSAILDYS